VRASLVTAGVMLVATGGPCAWSQTPETVRIVVPNVPGGAPDILARLLAEQIRQTQARRWWSRTIRARARWSEPNS
jgi:tripartite-type tricarboxylate transporter receptor subunit TctC